MHFLYFPLVPSLKIMGLFYDIPWPYHSSLAVAGQERTCLAMPASAIVVVALSTADLFDISLVNRFTVGYGLPRYSSASATEARVYLPTQDGRLHRFLPPSFYVSEPPPLHPSDYQFTAGLI